MLMLLSMARPRMRMALTLPALRAPQSMTLAPGTPCSSSPVDRILPLSMKSPLTAEMLYGISATVSSRRVAVTMISSIVDASSPSPAWSCASRTGWPAANRAAAMVADRAFLLNRVFLISLLLRMMCSWLSL
jgi:hypothetical protein